MTKSQNLPAAIGAVVVMILAVLAFQTFTDADTPSTQESTSTSVVDASEVEIRYSDLPTITVDELPIEALDTLDDIARGGPFAYPQDDGVFQNREGILPDRQLGHYREYTVDTPGSSTRGARRLVTGADGEVYYTDDHYESFREVLDYDGGVPRQ